MKLKISVVLLMCFLFLVYRTERQKAIIRQIITAKPIKVPNIIKQINSKNEIVKIFTCDECKVKLWNLIPFFASGKIYYEKDKKFRLIVNDMLDIGSNDVYFWFWIKGYRDGSIYYARHDQISTTGLRSVFMPDRFIEALGYKTIPEKSIFTRNGNKIYASDFIKSPQGRNLIDTTVITDSKITGYYLFDKLGPITEVRIEKINYLTANIFIRWYESNISMSIELKDPIINQPIRPNIFDLPDHHEKIDISNALF